MDKLIKYTTSPAFLFCGVGKYFLLINMLTAHMKYRKFPYNINKILYIYNLFQIIINLYMIYGLIEFLSFPNIFSINKAYSKI